MRINLCTGVSASPPLIGFQQGKLAADGNFYSPPGSYTGALAYYPGSHSIEAGELFLWGEDDWGIALDAWGNLFYDLDTTLASQGDNVGSVGYESVWRIPLPLTFHRIDSKDQVANLSDTIETSLQPKPDSTLLGLLPTFGGGLVADGVTPWIIKVNGIQPGRYTLTFGPFTGGSIANLQGRIRVLNGSTWSTSNVANLASENDTAYFYVEGIPATNVTGTEVTVTAKLTGNGQNFMKSIKVRKPPVVLVHGIFSDNKTWKPDFLEPIESVRGSATPDTGAAFVIPVSYASKTASATLPFVSAARALDSALEDQIENSDHGLRKDWAFTRYDGWP